MHNRLTVAIDLDDVLNDLTGPWVDWYNRTFHKSLTLEDITTFDIEAITGCDQIYEYLHLPGTFLNLPVQPGADTGLWNLCRLCKVYIVTSYTNADGNSINDKIAWVEKHFSFFPMERLVFCRDKSCIAANYLVDDALHNVENALGSGVVFDKPWNRKTSIDYPRVYNWNDLLGYFLAKHKEFYAQWVNMQF